MPSNERAPSVGKTNAQLAITASFLQGGRFVSASGWLPSAEEIRADRDRRERRDNDPAMVPSYLIELIPHRHVMRVADRQPLPGGNVWWMTDTDTAKAAETTDQVVMAVTPTKAELMLDLAMQLIRERAAWSEPFTVAFDEVSLVIDDGKIPLPLTDPATRDKLEFILRQGRVCNVPVYLRQPATDQTKGDPRNGK